MISILLSLRLMRLSEGTLWVGADAFAEFIPPWRDLLTQDEQGNPFTLSNPQRVVYLRFYESFYESTIRRIVDRFAERPYGSVDA